MYSLFDDMKFLTLELFLLLLMRKKAHGAGQTSER